MARNKLPERWLPYKPLGDRIKGTQFIAFKVPLSRAFNGKIEPDDRFSPESLLEKCPNLSLIIDLTNTTRYYNEQEFTSRKVHYRKIFCPGHEIPDLSIVKSMDRQIRLNNSSNSNVTNLYDIPGLVTNLDSYKLMKRPVNFEILRRFQTFEIPVYYKVYDSGVEDASNLSGTITLRELIYQATDLQFYVDSESQEKRKHITQSLQRFFNVVDSFLKQTGPDDLIGVHCTHGVNRTGYFICRYMIQRLGVDPDVAISDFKTARGHPIERQNYTEDLRSKLIDIPPLNPDEVEKFVLEPQVDLMARERSRRPRFRDRQSRPSDRSNEFIEGRYNDHDTKQNNRQPYQNRYDRSRSREIPNDFIGDRFNNQEGTRSYRKPPHQNRYRRSRSRETPRLTGERYDNNEGTDLFSHRYLQERFNREKLNEISVKRWEISEGTQSYPQYSHENRYQVSQLRETPNELTEEHYNKSETSQSYPQAYHQNQYESTVTNPTASYKRDNLKRATPYSNYRGRGSGRRGGDSQHNIWEPKTKDNNFSGDSGRQKSNYRNKNATGTSYSWRKDHPQQNQLPNNPDRFKWVARNSSQRETTVTDSHDV